MLRSRVEWDDYFMIETLWARVRSPDISTQCGCIIVNQNNQLLGQGYNGYPKKIDDNKMPQIRPDKYPPILHAEENAILNCTGSLEGSTLYVTGPPCIHCWAHIIQKGIKRVVYGPVTVSSNGQYAKESHQVIQDMLENQNIDVVKWIPINSELIQIELRKILRMMFTHI